MHWQGVFLVVGAIAVFTIWLFVVTRYERNDESLEQRVFSVDRYGDDMGIIASKWQKKRSQERMGYLTALYQETVALSEVDRIKDEASHQKFKIMLERELALKSHEAKVEYLNMLIAYFKKYAELGERVEHKELLDRMFLESGAGQAYINTEVKQLNSIIDIEHQKQDFETRFQANAQLKEYEDQRRKSFFGGDDEEE
jgi:hypothetical protein